VYEFDLVTGVALGFYPAGQSSQKTPEILATTRCNGHADLTQSACHLRDELYDQVRPDR
jgi:hypothetical protein